MSTEEQNHRADEQPRRSIQQKSRWPGWIWAIPIAALGIVVWISVRSFSSSGPKVTIEFPTIADLKPGDTDVKFQDMIVGKVQSVKVEKDLRHMRVKVKLHSEFEGHVGKGTRFWIEGQNLSLTDLPALKSLVSGPYIALQPAEGHQLQLYQGLSEPPVLRFGEAGTPFVLYSNKIDGIQHGTPVYYLDQKAGEVRASGMIGPHEFEITVVIKSPYDKLVHEGTRFWNAGAIQLTNGVGGPKLQLRSLPALVEGAIAFETPAQPIAGPPRKSYARFELYDGKEEAENAPDKQGVSYRVAFGGVSDSLSKYAPVKLMGSTIGSVSESKLEYSPATGELSIRATIVIEPRRIQLAGGQQWTDLRAQTDAMMQRLVARGLRAELSRSPPVIGGQEVVLRIVPGKTGAVMKVSDGTPEIPTASGSQVDQILANANEIESKINAMPLDQIANRINSSAANVDQVTDEARKQLPAAIDGARQSVAEAQATLASVQALMSANSSSSNQPQSTGVPKALYEMTRAARSLRQLSDFLDRHPEALIKGRGTHQ